MAIASFDVFDTLVTRTWAEPRDLFLVLGLTLRERGLTTRDAVDFAHDRRDAERRARDAGPTREITLEKIYAELGRILGWTDSQRLAAQQAEIELERASIHPVPGWGPTLAAARAQHGRLLFLSDMYLPPALLREILTEAGYCLPVDEVLVSGDVGAGKGTGDLFRHAQSRHAGAFAEWTHYGDNPHADHRAPRALGIDARLERRATLHPHEHYLRGPGTFAPPWRAQLGGVARLARLAAPAGLDATQQELWSIGATVAGPLFWAFTRWCLDRAAHAGLTDLYFLARDGQIFHRIADRLAPRGLRTHYLLTSRLAFTGIFDADNPARLRELAAAPLAFHSVRQALRNLGLPDDTPLDPARWPEARRDDNLPPAERAALADWLLAPERLPRVAAALAERASLARDYLRDAGLVPGQKAGVVDTGWAGTIQKNLEHLLGHDGPPVALHGFYLGLFDVRPFACAGPTLGYTNTFQRLSLRRETTHLIMLETMSRGTHGPLLGFARTQNKVTPCFGPLSDARRAEVELFQDAVLAFVDQAARAPAAWPDAADLAAVVIGNYRDFFQRPSRAESAAFGAIPHSDQMLEQRHSSLCQPMTLRELVRAMRSFHDRPPGWWLAGQAQLGHAPLLRTYQWVKNLKWALQTRLTGRPD